MWPRLLVASLGVWIMAAPAVFGYDGAPANSDHIVGPIVATFAIMAASHVLRPLRRVNTLAGAWIAIAPMFVGHPGIAALNAVATGLLITALSLVGSYDPEEFAGGWSTLWRKRS